MRGMHARAHACVPKKKRLPTAPRASPRAAGNALLRLVAAVQGCKRLTQQAPDTRLPCFAGMLQLRARARLRANQALRHACWWGSGRAERSQPPMPVPSFPWRFRPAWPLTQFPARRAALWCGGQRHRPTATPRGRCGWRRPALCGPRAWAPALVGPAAVQGAHGGQAEALFALGCSICTMCGRRRKRMQSGGGGRGEPPAVRQPLPPSRSTSHQDHFWGCQLGGVRCSSLGVRPGTGRLTTGLPGPLLLRMGLLTRISSFCLLWVLAGLSDGLATMQKFLLATVLVGCIALASGEWAWTPSRAPPPLPRAQLPAAPPPHKRPARGRAGACHMHRLRAAPPSPCPAPASPRFCGPVHACSSPAPGCSRCMREC